MTHTLEDHPTGIYMPHVLAGNPTLPPGGAWQLDLNAAPRFGANRQGGCNSINVITDARLGRCLEMVTGDGDHTLPGTNPLAGGSGPGQPGGCYAVHRVGGVAADLIAPVTLAHDREWFVRVKVAIPSAQPGLAGGKFPGVNKGQWLSLHECYGAPMKGAPVTSLAVWKDASGQDCFVYGPAGQPHSFWLPLTLDTWFDFIIGCTPSWNPAVGGASVTCNGVALKSKSGNVFEHYQTEIASDGGGGPSAPSNFVAAAQQYRSIPFGGSLRTLLADFRVGDTLASIAGGSTPPPPPPPPSPGTPPPPPPVTPPPVVPPVTPPAGTVSLSTAEAAALGRYIRAHGIPTGMDGPLISAIASRLPARH